VRAIDDHLGPPRRAEVVLASAVGVLAIVEGLTADVGSHRVAALVSWLLLAAGLAWTVRAPAVPALVTAAVLAVQTIAGISINTALAVTIAVVASAYACGHGLGVRRGLLPVLAMAAAATASIVTGARSVPENLAFAGLVLAAPFALGTAMRARQRYTEVLEQQAALLRERASLLERQGAEEAARAVAEERARIARELHDVIAHSLTVIGLQAGGVRRLLRPDQERERQALLVVERTGRQAQEEMRHLLTLLRGREEEEDRNPQPGLDALASLVEEAAAPSRRTCLELTGDPAAVPPALGLAAYRIVQEALTNVRRHSDASRVEVRVACRPGELALEVLDDGPALEAVSGGGYGLVGMRERAALYGGTLEAGPVPAGGFRVAATLGYGTGAA
jgi:signal transduction histidine kinase